MLGSWNMFIESFGGRRAGKKVGYQLSGINSDSCVVTCVMHLHGGDERGLECLLRTGWRYDKLVVSCSGEQASLDTWMLLIQRG